MKQELVLKIEGMHCGACVRRVNLALSRLNGLEIQQVEIGQAKIQYDSDKTSESEIHAAIREMGFDLIS